MQKQVYLLAILFTILCVPFIAKAQTNNYEDLVYLKNGSIIHGMIIEQIPNQSIKIQKRNGDVFVYKLDEIEKITKEPVNNSNSNTTDSGNDEIRHSGYTNITEFSFGPGTGLGQSGTSTFGSGANYFYSIQTINGYLFNPYFSMGLGIGADQYSQSVALIPVFVDFRANLSKKKVAPFTSFDVGYSFSRNGDINTGGLLINPAFGLKIILHKYTALNFSLGFKFQENGYSYSPYNGFYPQPPSIIINSTAAYLNLKMGVTF